MHCCDIASNVENVDHMPDIPIGLFYNGSEQRPRFICNNRPRLCTVWMVCGMRPKIKSV